MCALTVEKEGDDIGHLSCGVYRKMNSIKSGFDLLLLLLLPIDTAFQRDSFSECTIVHNCAFLNFRYENFEIGGVRD